METGVPAGLPSIYHGCGNVLPLLDDLLAMGIDALHPIKPKAINIYDLKKKLYGKVAIIGNVSVDLLTNGTPQMIESDMKEHIRRLAPDGGYVISSSNSIAYYVPIRNYSAFLEYTKVRKLPNQHMTDALNFHDRTWIRLITPIQRENERSPRGQSLEVCCQ